MRCMEPTLSLWLVGQVTAAAGDALMEQQHFRDTATRLKAENAKLRREAEATPRADSGKVAAAEKERVQNMKLRTALESLMSKHKEVVDELKELKRERRATEFEADELREQLAGQHEQIGTVDALQSMLVRNQPVRHCDGLG